MAEPLDGIVRAVESDDYRLSGHYWEYIAAGEDKPTEDEIFLGIADDLPEIIEPYPNDPRGASCLILCETPFATWIHVQVAYWRRPMRVVTAYYPDPSKWLDERNRVP
jgi:hypothetical protein